jgi:hypothetical protein
MPGLRKLIPSPARAKRLRNGRVNNWVIRSQLPDISTTRPNLG